MTMGRGNQLSQIIAEVEIECKDNNNFMTTGAAEELFAEINGDL
jgi:hypothetical protein